MKGFREWLMEARVRGSAAGDAMRKTLDFKLDAEWIKWSVEPKGWITDQGVKDSFDLAASFYSPKVKRPAFFYVRAFAILDRPDAEYDSVSGGSEMKINAELFLFSGKTGLGSVPGYGTPKSMQGVLDREGHIRLSQRADQIRFPGALSEFDGPSIKTPLQLADWMNVVIDHVDLGGEDGGDDEPEQPDIPSPGGRRLVGV